MIIVRKIHSWIGVRSQSLALCEEVRRTPMRVYVRLVQNDQGYISALSGRDNNPYCDIAEVIAWNATKDQFQEILSLIKDERALTQRLDDARRDLQAHIDRQIDVIAKGGVPTPWKGVHI